MRVLVDACVPRSVVTTLSEAGIDALWAADLPDDPGDDEVLRFAAESQRVVVTLDRHLGEDAVVHRRKRPGILRLVNMSIDEIEGMCLDVLERHTKDLEAGAMITATRRSVRVHEPEAEPVEQEAEPAPVPPGPEGDGV